MEQETYRVIFTNGKEELWTGFGCDEYTTLMYVLADGHKRSEIKEIVREA